MSIRKVCCCSVFSVICMAAVATRNPSRLSFSPRVPPQRGGTSGEEEREEEQEEAAEEVEPRGACHTHRAPAGGEEAALNRRGPGKRKGSGKRRGMTAPRPRLERWGGSDGV